MVNEMVTKKNLGIIVMLISGFIMIPFISGIAAIGFRDDLVIEFATYAAIFILGLSQIVKK